MKRLTIRSAFLALAIIAAIAAPVAKLSAQSDFTSAIRDYFDHWTDRVEAAQAAQPKWITPLATVTPRLEQEFRYDQNRQTLKNGSTVDVYGGGKGLELIPTERTEVIITVPSYQVRSGPAHASGFADWPGILLKYRLISENEKAGDYIVTLFAQYGLPTGALVYTNHNHVFTPTIAAGKGFGDFDIQATLGESFPTHDHGDTGKSVLTNITAQYHVSKLFWPELEMNRTDWIGGGRDARSQTYLTPGLIIGRFVLGGRSKLIAGLGYQTSISKKYPTSPTTRTFNHNWIASVRVTF